MLISAGQFKRFKAEFYKKTIQSPHVCTLRLTAFTSANAIEGFVGDSERTFTDHNFPCLYEKIVSPRQREKYGLPDEVNGVIFLSPMQLVPVYGTFRIDKNKTSVIFQGHKQVIDKVSFDEDLFNDCIAVRIDLKDALKGG